MSKPYFNINSLTASGATVSVNWTYFKVRTNIGGGGTVSIDGFSNSVTMTLSGKNNTPDAFTLSNTSGSENDNITFGTMSNGGNLAITALGTSSTTTYNPPSYTITFGGTVSSTTNLKMQILGVQVINSTASATVAPTVSNFLSAISFTFSGAAAAFSATISGNSIIFSAPGGNWYNGLTLSNAIVQAASSFATASGSQGTTFSGGLNNYTLYLNYLPMGPVRLGNDTFTYSI